MLLKIATIFFYVFIAPLIAMGLTAYCVNVLMFSGLTLALTETFGVFIVCLVIICILLKRFLDQRAQ